MKNLKIGSRALVLGATSAALLAASLGIGTGSALAAYTAHVKGGTLLIAGDAASDKLALRLQPGSPGTLQVDVGDDGTADFSFDRSTFTAIDVKAGGGDDQVRVDQSGGTFTDEAVTLDGGAGNDTLLGGDGADTLLGGSGADFVDGNRGADRALLGSGDDRYQWDPGDGSDVVDGQGGRDQLDFNGSNAGERIDLAADGSRARLTRDVAAISMDLGGIDQVNVRTLGGADTVTVGDLAGTGVKTVDVNLDATGGVGDGSPDTVVARGTDGPDRVSLGNADGRLVVAGLAAQTRVSGGEAANDSIVIATLGGEDTVTTTATVTGAVPVRVDGGEGNDTARFNGTAGPDQIAIAGDGTHATTFAASSTPLVTDATVESLIVSGLAGDDTITGSNGLAAASPLTIDGGSGNDTLAGGDGNDILLGGPGNDHVEGNRGADQAQLGTGDDRFQWDPGDGSDTVEGQGGHDQLDFNGSNAGEHIELAANGPRLRLTRDVAAITMDTAGIQIVHLETLGGADTVTVDDLAGTDVKTADVNLDATGGGGDGSADTVIARGTDGPDHVALSNADGRLVVGGLAAQTRVAGGEAANDSIVVATGGGDDTVTTTAAVTGAVPVRVDGGDGNDTARFNGTAGPDQIAIAGNGIQATTFAAGITPLVTDATVESLVVSGLAGDDTITGSNGLATASPLTIDGGDGNDTLSGGDGNDTLIGGPGNDFVDGNRGADQALLGAGDDTFQWDPGDGSDVVEGQSGRDVLAFNGSNVGERIELSSNGPRLRLTRDVGAITMDTDGIETVGVRTLGGPDTVTVDDLAGTDVKAVNVGLAATDGTGDGAADTVVVNGTNNRDVVRVTRFGDQVAVAGLAAETRIAGSEPALDTLRVQTLDGGDDVTVAPDVAALIAPVVDLGPGEL